MRSVKVFSLGILALVIGFPSCKRESPSVCYNNILVNGKNSIDNYFLSFDKQINNTLNNQQYSLIAEYCKIVLDSINNKTASIEGIEYPINAYSFRDAFLLYSKSVQEVIKSYENYAILSDENATLQQLDSVNSIIKNSERQVRNSLNNLLLRQMEFAAKENLRLEYKEK